MESLAILLPLIGVVVSLFTTLWIGSTGLSLLLVANMGLSFLVSLKLFYWTAVNQYILKFTFSTWVDFFWGTAVWGFWADNVTSLMLLTVTLVSFAVHVYSLYYMASDPHLPRFLAYLSIFTFFMLFLISSDNLIQLFFGWEGVGLCSYLLINFWYTRPQANKAALKAIMVNRVGDCGVLMAIVLLVNKFGSIQLQNIFLKLANAGPDTVFLFSNVRELDLICFCLFIGVMAKSAQLGLHTWLPDAMEGPTPVSALIHAATMVTAGIYLMIRTAPLFECSPSVLTFAALVGGLTALFAATVALAQNDMKKIIAYSTCSQLGYMVMACGVTHFSLALFHLVNHAFFKALLFMGAGIVIHCFGGEQDLRRMGGLQNIFPFGLATMATASAALSGLPFLAGFYSKDFILGTMLVQVSHLGNILWCMGVAAAICTSLYSAGLIYYVFFGTPRGTQRQYVHLHGIPLLAHFPLALLGFGSVVSGYLFKDFLIGPGAVLHHTPLSLFTGTAVVGDFTEWVPLWAKFVTFFISLLGLLTYVFFSYAGGLIYLFNRLALYRFLFGRWYWDHVHNEFIAKPIFLHGYVTVYRLLDKGIIEGLGLNFLTAFGLWGARQVALFQRGELSRYLFWFITSFFIFWELGLWLIVN